MEGEDKAPPQKILLKLQNLEEKKQDIRKLSIEELSLFLKKNGEKPFRAKQIEEWIWQKSVTDFSLMSNLSHSLRSLLEANFAFYPISIGIEQKSNDGTIKSSFKLHDGHFVEGVLIPISEENRMTACISSQVGCSLSCKFCATGYMDKKRNLDAAELYDQVLLINKQAKENFDNPLTNIVFMGMGEPLLNYQNLIKGIDRITSPMGLNISTKRITVSTAGIAKMIIKLADDAVKFNLALSLHAANDHKRSQIMDINESNMLAALGNALQYFSSKTNNRITLEYILFNQFNDSLKDAQELVNFARKVHSHVNIIEYNPIREAQFAKSNDERIKQFADYLMQKNIMTTIRRSRGRDIDAACGQLANKK